MKLSEYKTNKEKELGEKISYTKIAAVLGYTKQYVSKIKEELLQEKQISVLDNYFNKMLNKCSIDKKLLTEIITLIEECLEENDLKLKADKKAELITLIYDLYISNTIKDLNNDNIINFCKIAI